MTEVTGSNLGSSLLCKKQSKIVCNRSGGGTNPALSGELSCIGLPFFYIVHDYCFFYR